MGTSVAATKNAESHLSAWHRYPTMYEINTWVWLFGIEPEIRKDGYLASVPAAEWDAMPIMASMLFG